MKYWVHKRPTSVGLFDDFERLFGCLPMGNTWGRRSPAVDLQEEKDRYVLEVELPGLTEKDIEVNISDSTLTISTTKGEDQEKRTGDYLLRERHDRGFERSFRLPEDATAENIEAVFANGILRLEIAKNPESQPRNVKIKVT